LIIAADLGRVNKEFKSLKGRAMSANQFGAIAITAGVLLLVGALVWRYLKNRNG
jgi:hypothetical protein